MCITETSQIIAHNFKSRLIWESTIAFKASEAICASQSRSFDRQENRRAVMNHSMSIASIPETNFNRLLIYDTTSYIILLGARHIRPVNYSSWKIEKYGGKKRARSKTCWKVESTNKILIAIDIVPRSLYTSWMTNSNGSEASAVNSKSTISTVMEKVIGV